MGVVIILYPLDVTVLIINVVVKKVVLITLHKMLLKV